MAVPHPRAAMMVVQQLAEQEECEWSKPLHGQAVHIVSHSEQPRAFASSPRLNKRTAATELD